MSLIDGIGAIQENPNQYHNSDATSDLNTPVH